MSIKCCHVLENAWPTLDNQEAFGKFIPSADVAGMLTMRQVSLWARADTTEHSGRKAPLPWSSSPFLGGCSF